MKLGKYIIGLVSGLTFGMLFAPKKGKELRKSIAKKSATSNLDGFKVLGDAFLEASQDMYKELEKLMDHEQIRALKEVSKDKWDELREKAKDEGMDVGAKVQEKFEAAAELLTSKAHELRAKAKQVIGKVKQVELNVKKSTKKKVRKAKAAVRKTVKKEVDKVLKVVDKKTKTIVKDKKSNLKKTK